ncbi:MAG: nitrous oxide reductase family maturation protein NosD [Calditrichales bacterium]|nr:MAG: nitrous oxide reductase family maturation protein NosD [Calditrichales bacterium]
MGHKLAITLSILYILISTAAANRISVRATSGNDPIKLALQQAADGDTIMVYQGHYDVSNLQIDKQVVMIGVNYPVLDGNHRDALLNVRADNVTISGFNLQNAGISYINDNAAIRLDSVKNCTVANNRLRNNFFAIYLARVENCVVSHNQIESNPLRETSAGNGIHLWYCKNVRITDNTVKGHRDGIYFEFVQEGLVEGNISERNLRYGLHFMFSDHCRYQKNTFRNNGAGVAVMYTKHVVMTDNIFEYNWGPASFGILLKEISDSDISGNRFTHNSTGLYSEGSTRLKIEHNLFEYNGWAVKVMANSMDNLFSANDFISNSFDVATNSRQNFNTFDANYWHKYTGYDLNRDGVGDVPFRPVGLFSLIVEKQHPALVLLNSFFVDLLEISERIFPVLTPKTLVDNNPRMRRSH